MDERYNFTFTAGLTHLIDPSWIGDERQIVLDCISKLHGSRYHHKLSKCRLCDCTIDSQIILDEGYGWPKSLHHYIAEHNLKPPQDLIDYCVRMSANKKTL